MPVLQSYHSAMLPRPDSNLRNIQPDFIATGCPFCNTMMTDGVKNKEKEEDVKVLDIAEMIATAIDL